MRGARITTTVVLAGLLVAACSSSSNSSPPTAVSTSSRTTSPAGGPSSTIVPAPAGLPSFYSFSLPVPSKPGTLVKSIQIAAPNVKGKVYRILYTSTTVADQPTPVTGLVFVPKTPAPAGGYPVVSWAHPTNGMADSCAPSLTPDNAVPLINTLLDKGWEVTATDYQGEGTPGLLPYAAGDSAARNTIDIVRAARNFPAASASDKYVVWGHSEGGQTAMFTLKIGPTYAPELHLQGVVANAPPSQFFAGNSLLKTTQFLLMAVDGLHAAYGDTVGPLDQILTPLGITMTSDLDKGCSNDFAQKYFGVDISRVTRADPVTIPSWKAVLEENDPGTFTAKSPVPLLIVQGGDDELISVESSLVLANHLCSLHQDLERWVYPGLTHSGVIAPSGPDMVRWISDRFAGAANPDPYKPTGLANIDRKTSASRVPAT